MVRDIRLELKELRLHGMSVVWGELTTHDGKVTDVGIQTSRWLIEYLLQAEHAGIKVPCDQSPQFNAKQARSGRSAGFNAIQIRAPFFKVRRAAEPSTVNSANGTCATNSSRKMPNALT